MRIEGTLPSYYSDTLQGAPQQFAPAEPQKTGMYGPGVVVEISPEARAAYDKAQERSRTQGIGAVEESQGCETCRNRKYVDKSDDPSVSFQTPAHISPGQAAGTVMAHEREHVTNEQARAERDNRRVVSQTVALTMSTCPECGRVYVSGGVTRTVTANNKSNESETIDTGEKNAEL